MNPLKPPADLTCIHEDHGLCEECADEFEESPLDYLHYGNHPAGIENLRRLDAEMEAARPELEAEQPTPDDVQF